MKSHLALALAAFGLGVSCQPKSDEARSPASPAGPAATTPSGSAIDLTTPASLIGHRLEAVEAACEAAEVSHRVIERDGESLPATMDYRPDRLNFSVRDGVVVDVTKG